jgi:hypothetical protein
MGEKKGGTEKGVERKRRTFLSAGQAETHFQNQPTTSSEGL